MRLPIPAFAGLFLVCGLAAAIAPAIAQDPYANLPYPGEADTGLYIGLRGSMAFRGKDGAISVPTAPTPTALRGSHDTGYGGAIVLGGHLPEGFKVELEGSWRHRPYDSKTLGGITTAATGFRDTGAVMGNLLWEAPLPEYTGLPIRPFIGGGAGLAYTEARLSDNPTSTNRYLASSSDWRFAWQAMAGFKVDVAPGARLTAAYRYMQINGVRSACGTGGAPTMSCRRNAIDQGVDLGVELDL
jgi:opacity protein-like surface antigen